jgi:integrase
MKGLVSDVDRHGNRRYYFRAPDRPKVRLREPYGTDSFLEEFRCAKLGIPLREVPPEPDRSPAAQPGTLKWLCLEYLRRGCADLNASTLKAKGYALEAICTTPIAGKETLYGRMPYAYLNEADVEHLRDIRKHLAHGANYWVKQLRAMFAWAMETKGKDGRPLAAMNPALGVKRFKVASEGFHTWSVAEIEQYQKRHALGTQADLAFRLCLFTAMRISDVARLGRQNVYERQVTEEDGITRTQRRIRLTPKKTASSSGVVVDIAILPPLAEALDRLPKNQMVFLQSSKGRAYSDKSLSNMVKDWCRQAGLPHCSAHGLRKAFSTIMAEDGATDRQLMALMGWTNARQAEVYTRAAERRRLADEGTKRLKML